MPATRHVAHNLALVRHIALKPMRLSTCRETIVETKQLLASSTDEFRAELLGFGVRADAKPNA